MSLTNDKRCAHCGRDCNSHSYWIGCNGPLCESCTMSKTEFIATPQSYESFFVKRIRELEAELAVRDNSANEVLRILRESTGRRDFHSEMEAAEWAARMILDLQTQLFLEKQSAKEAMSREAAAVSREIGARAELAEARRDGARLDWLQEWMKFGRNDLLTRYRVFDGKVYANRIHPDDAMGAKAISGQDNIRAAIDAAMKEAK